MKYVPIYVVIILSLFTACSQENSDEVDVAVKEATLTNFEENLVDMTSDSAFMYDVQVNNEDVEDLRLTVDFYEKGEFVDRIVDISSMVSEADAKEPIRSVFTQLLPDEKQEKWMAAVMTNDGYSSGESPQMEVKDRKEWSATSGAVNLPVEFKKGEKKIIGSMIYSNENAVSRASNIETEEELKKATDYKQAYIMSIEVK